MPQPQTAAPPRPQEEEETDKSKQAQIEQTYEKHQDYLSSPSEVIAILKELKTQEQNDTRKDIQQIASVEVWIPKILMNDPVVLIKEHQKQKSETSFLTINSFWRTSK